MVQFLCLATAAADLSMLRDLPHRPMRRIKAGALLNFNQLSELTRRFIFG
jgi:hypothetical protein